MRPVVSVTPAVVPGSWSVAMLRPGRAGDTAAHSRYVLAAAVLLTRRKHQRPGIVKNDSNNGTNKT